MIYFYGILQPNSTRFRTTWAVLSTIISIAIRKEAVVVASRMTIGQNETVQLQTTCRELSFCVVCERNDTQLRQQVVVCYRDASMSSVSELSCIHSFALPSKNCNPFIFAPNLIPSCEWDWSTSLTVHSVSLWQPIPPVRYVFDPNWSTFKHASLTGNVVTLVGF